MNLELSSYTNIKCQKAKQDQVTYRWYSSPVNCNKCRTEIVMRASSLHVRLGGGGTNYTLPVSFYICCCFFFVKWWSACAHQSNSINQGQSMVTNRAEVTVVLTTSSSTQHELPTELLCFVVVLHYMCECLIIMCVWLGVKWYLFTCVYVCTFHVTANLYKEGLDFSICRAEGLKDRGDNRLPFHHCTDQVAQADLYVQLMLTENSHNTKHVTLRKHCREACSDPTKKC